jgi:hypothetical protein
LQRSRGIPPCSWPCAKEPTSSTWG